MRNPARIVCRGRPRCFDPERGVEVAARLFRERGYDAVGVAELGRAIGIKPPSFYAAYGSKKALLARVLKRYGACDGGFVDDLAQPGRPLTETAAALFAAAANAYTADPKARGCLVLEGTRNSTDEEACALTRAAHEALRGRLVEWIAAAAPDAAGELSDFVLVTLAGLSAEARRGADRDKLRVSARIAAAGFGAEVERLGLSALSKRPVTAGDRDHSPQTNRIIGMPTAVTITSSGRPRRQ
jgi:TetR/AcrR family transcriptional repressor for divergent bdcA